MNQYPKYQVGQWVVYTAGGGGNNNETSGLIREIDVITRITKDTQTHSIKYLLNGSWVVEDRIVDILERKAKT